MNKRLQKKKNTIKNTAAKAVETVKETTEKVVDKIVEETPVLTEAISSKTEEILVETKAKTVRTKFSEINIEIFETSVSVDAIKAAIKAELSKRKIKGDIKIYINTDQRMAYYTVDGEGSEEYKIDLRTL